MPAGRAELGGHREHPLHHLITFYPGAHPTSTNNVLSSKPNLKGSEAAPGRGKEPLDGGSTPGQKFLSLPPKLSDFGEVTQPLQACFFI